MSDDPAHDSPAAGAERARPRLPIDVYSMEGIGAVISRLRREAGFSQTEFGALVGASRPWISDLERGNLRGGQLDTVLSCIHALGYRLVLEDLDSKPSRLDDMKNAMRHGPLARRRVPPSAAPRTAEARTQTDAAHLPLAHRQPPSGDPAASSPADASP